MTNILLRRYEKLSGADAETLLSFSRKEYIRVNPLAGDVDNTLERLKGRGVEIAKIPWLNSGFSYKSSFSLGASEEFLLGRIHIQDASSQLPVDIAKQIVSDPKLIVDMAAAPGGKTSQLAAVFPAARIVAFESNRKRASSLKNNLERLQTANVEAYLKDARYTSDLFSGADLVLLDAPCSGNFALHKHWFSRREKQGYTMQSELQIELLKEALRVAKKGGYVIYSTCSLETSENEAVLTQALGSDDEIIPLSLEVGDAGVSKFESSKYRDDCKNAIRIWPHKLGTQAFFVAVIRKN